MKKNLLPIIIFTLLFVKNLNAQIPKWTDPQWRKVQYNDEQYLVGFASEVNKSKQDQGELLQKLEGYAKSQLSDQVQVSISSITDLSVTETTDKFQEYFKKNCSSASGLNIAGLKTEKYYDQKEKTAYALAYTKKSEVYDLYKNTIDLKKKTIEQKIEAGVKYAAASDNQKALNSYLECFPIFREIEEAQGIYIALKNKLTDEADLKIKEVQDLKIKVDNAVSALQTSSGNTLDDVCFFISNALKLQAPSVKEPMRLSNFTYQDMKMGSEFSRKLTMVLEQKLVSPGGFNVTTEAITSEGGEKNKYLLIGTYWEEKEKIKIIANLRNSDGKTVASAEAFLPVSWVKENNLQVKPENFQEAFSTMKAFKMNEVSGGNLNVETWTNKGSENIIYSAGEKMKLFVRANKECYLRFVYHLADGQRVLLLDNYYIGSDKINKVYELPYEFECSEPFGVEVLQVNAQTENFPQLTTKKQDGYDFITDDLTTTLVKTRGMKKVESNTALLKTEKRVVITTMKK
ncbi:MAG: hypothetical protein A2275_01040 [Bacteroidetes bacterium RIFOXYA12_FULL_35_11]|nr:MAG: hypothetical protein A2X01_20020 [Bacteroidetes bacterium GWF2_35_48]OFY77160.1 MAG: hypothetical protein A2275_01040 [Bacteroidetes bacterium RIFOXYA12_FULL_35_11]OFY93266.1 MAG: hypothetical protein A2491_16235 [Bacteroidetes bacterium RIFOXYC12_FULL_35_7]HBX50104.1 hypothetical protein [Bacteroidales bacterium]